MPEIDANSIYNQLGLNTPRDQETKANDELGQAQFLELMTTQLRYQDPLKPMENGDFLGQMAQFGTVSGINDLNVAVNGMSASFQSNQALQASTMVGRTVLVPGDVGLLETGAELRGAVEMPSSSADLKVLIHDASGQLVRQLDLGTQPAGTVHFAWDGSSDSGGAVATGTYRVSAQAFVDGKAVTQVTLIQARVESVTLGRAGNDSSLNLRGLGAVQMNEIREIL